jgi:hypothetical protein
VRYLSSLALSLALSACAASKRSESAETRIKEGDGVKTGEEGAPPSTVHVDEINPDQSACEALEAEAARLAAEAAECERDEQCRVHDISVCDTPGLGCYYVLVNREAPLDALDTAIKKIETGPCPQADCDCPAPPKKLLCKEGRCVDARSVETAPAP